MMDVSKMMEYLLSLDRYSEPLSVSTVKVGETYIADAYPTVAASWYAMSEMSVGGDEEEGSTADFYATGAVFRAFNLGSNIPTAGTRHLCYSIEGYYVFRA